MGLRPFAEQAQVAQLVEHATENRSVGGSIPPLGTMTLPHSCAWRLILQQNQLVALIVVTRGDQ